ncbi:hypothetical protein [Hydrogenophaga sp. NFH-34]|uniref:hypothetical protein n=1 Tax=Hydrogenophaga sp. NFH-34 TaxID=2744446 RepID=UPI001F3BABC0|nr:hypothetical protein [Hydrogenophaga sp. NFH-34]
MAKWIACTEQTASEFKDAIRGWPEVDNLIRGLQAQGVFPGMKNMRMVFDPEKIAPEDPLRVRLQALQNAEDARLAGGRDQEG